MMELDHPLKPILRDMVEQREPVVLILSEGSRIVGILESVSAGLVSVSKREPRAYGDSVASYSEVPTHYLLSAVIGASYRP